jgi:hypothetical protein
MEKKIIAAIAALIIGGAILGSYFYPKFSTGSSAGATFNSAKISAIAGFAPASASATTTNLYNSDTSDRIIEDAFVSCNTVGTSKTYLTGTGLESLQFNFSTSSTATGYGRTNTANAFIVTVATSTSDAYVASSTIPFPNQVSRIWPAGSYLVIGSNATNTASCLTGVHYLAL